MVYELRKSGLKKLFHCRGATIVFVLALFLLPACEVNFEGEEKPSIVLDDSIAAFPLDEDGQETMQVLNGIALDEISNEAVTYCGVDLVFPDNSITVSEIRGLSKRLTMCGWEKEEDRILLSSFWFSDTHSCVLENWNSQRATKATKNILTPDGFYTLCGNAESIDGLTIEEFFRWHIENNETRKDLRIVCLRAYEPTPERSQYFVERLKSQLGLPLRYYFLDGETILLAFTDSWNPWGPLTDVRLSNFLLDIGVEGDIVPCTDE